MSVYQIRLHFLIYLSVLRIFREKDINVGDQHERNKLKIFVPYTSATLTLQPEPPAAFHSIFTHAINGLYSDGLISSFSYGDTEHIKKTFPNASAPGFVVEPNFAGAELFLWAVGEQDPNGHKLLLVDLDKVERPITVDELAVPLSPP